MDVSMGQIFAATTPTTTSLPPGVDLLETSGDGVLFGLHENNVSGLRSADYGADFEIHVFIPSSNPLLELGIHQINWEAVLMRVYSLHPK
jgi:hypothetical protein